MEVYSTRNQLALTLRETYGGDSGPDNMKYFSPELRNFKQFARSSVNSLRLLFLETNLDFNTENIKRNTEEEFRLLMSVTFCVLDSSARPEEGIFFSQGKEVETGREFLKKIEAEGITDFRLTPVPMYQFDHEQRSLNADLVFKVHNKKNGKNFFINMNNRVASSLIEFAEECVGNFLVCFPRDGSYDIDPQLGKVPLEFCSISKSSWCSTLIPASINIIGTVLSLVFSMTPFALNPYIMGLGNIVAWALKTSVSTYLRDSDKRIQNALNDLSNCTGNVSKAVVKVVDTCKSSPKNSILIEDPTYLNFLKELEKTIRVDSHPYEKTKEFIREFIEGIQMESKRSFISALNAYCDEHNTGIGELTRCGRESRDDCSDSSLESFIKKTGKMGSSGCDKPGWSFRFSLGSAPRGWNLHAGQDTVVGYSRNKRRVILEVKCKGGWNGVISVLCLEKSPMKQIKN